TTWSLPTTPRTTRTVRGSAESQISELAEDDAGFDPLRRDSLQALHPRTFHQSTSMY
ncbi:hypothetical protein BKA82DRAFT_1003554, partial [Pisolithus tinctorius]